MELSNQIEKIAVVTDSCADVPAELVEQYHIFVLPMVINCEDGEHKDGVDINAEMIYQKLKTELPKTSSPSGEDIISTFEKIKAEGYTKAVVISLSGSLSGSVNHIRLAAESIKDLEIKVYDSKQGSIGIGVIAIQAAQYVSLGMSFEALQQKIEGLIQNTKVFFSIDTLEYLQKGGRIGKATALLGSVMQIKPILSFDEIGEIYSAAKVRGKKMVESKLIKLVEEYMQEGKPYNLVIADGGAAAERDELEEKIKAMFPNYQALYKAKIGAALSVYLGSGLLGAGIQFLED